MIQQKSLVTMMDELGKIYSSFQSFLNSDKFCSKKTKLVKLQPQQRQLLCSTFFSASVSPLIHTRSHFLLIDILLQLTKVRVV